jgi:elongation factor G
VLEDTSLSYKFEQETGQYLVSGLGELHLEILRDRLKGEGLPVKMGNLRINYK